MPAEREQPELLPNSPLAIPARGRPREPRARQHRNAPPSGEIWRRSPGTVIFEERDGLLWLRGKDLDRAKSLLGLRCDSPAVGFDPMTWSIHVAQLAKKRVPMELVVGETISKIRFDPDPRRSEQPGVPIDLSAVQLVGQREMERLLARFTRTDSRLRRLAAIGAEESVKGGGKVGKGGNTLFAYQVDDEIYELDLELTAMDRSTVEALLVGAHLQGSTLRCQLVPPRSRRPRRSASGILLVPVKDRLPFGQLKLPL